MFIYERHIIYNCILCIWVENMVTNFTVFGSCACRDIFNSTINKNYKDFFKIGGNGIRLSFISIMQPPVEYDDNDLRIFPEIGKNPYLSRWIKNDFDKIFLDELKENKFEYMLMDTYYDVNFGVVDIGNNHYVTNNIRIDQTNFYKNLENKRVLKITDNKKEYFKLWKEHCDLFFNFMNENCPNIKIILNPSRHISRVLSENGLISINNKYEDECNLYNSYRDLLDEYIVKNFDIDVLIFDDNTLINSNHLWGSSSLHYYTEYYHDMTNQLNKIIKRNNLLNTGELLLLNKDIRQEKRHNLLTKLKQNKQHSLEFNPDQLTIDKNISVLKKYNEKILNTFIYEDLNLNIYTLEDSSNGKFIIKDKKNKFPEYEFQTKREANDICDFLNNQEEIIIRLFKNGLYEDIC